MALTLSCVRSAYFLTCSRRCSMEYVWYIPRMKFTAGDTLMVVLIAQTARDWVTRVYIDKLDN